jgi:hypothetical protein
MVRVSKRRSECNYWGVIFSHENFTIFLKFKSRVTQNLQIIKI